MNRPLCRCIALLCPGGSAPLSDQRGCSAGNNAHGEQGGCKQGQIFFLLRQADWPCLPLLLQVVRHPPAFSSPTPHSPNDSPAGCAAPPVQRGMVSEMGVLKWCLRHQGGCASAPCRKLSSSSAANAPQCDFRNARSYAVRSPCSWCAHIRSLFNPRSLHCLKV